MHAPAERGDATVLDVMLRCGFDPHARDKDGVTALHVAAMAGQAEAVRVLLAHGASPAVTDDMFSATPLVWAAEAWQQGESRRGDHLTVARLLAGAGSPLEWIPPQNAPDPERGQEKLIDLCQAAGIAAAA
jgi:ankyrin repeat protein